MSNNAGINKTIEDLYADMYPKLFIYAKNSLGDFHLAEEAVQETFRIACAKSAQLIESQNRPGWLTNTLKYVIYNTRRSQAKFSNLLMIITTAAEMSPEISEDNTELAMYCTSILGKEDFELILAFYINGLIKCFAVFACNAGYKYVINQPLNHKQTEHT